MVTLRTVRGLVPGARARGAAGFSFRGGLTANELSELRDHGPGRRAAGTSRTKRTPGPGGKAGIALGKSIAARPRPHGPEASRAYCHSSSMRFKTALRTVAGTVSRGSDW